MNDEKGQFLEQVNKVLVNFENARRDPRLPDEAVSNYALTNVQVQDLKQFLMLKGKGQANLKTSTRPLVRDLIVLFSILGLFGSKRHVFVVLPQPESFVQIYSRATEAWYQLLGIRTLLALGIEGDGSDMSGSDIFLTTPDSFYLFKKPELRASDNAISRLLADSEFHFWEGSDVTWDNWKVTQSHTIDQPQPQPKKWWGFGNK